MSKNWQYRLPREVDMMLRLKSRGLGELVLEAVRPPYLLHYSNRKPEIYSLKRIRQDLLDLGTTRIVRVEKARKSFLKAG